MSAVIFAFDRARRTAADLTDNGVILRVRFSARVAGCNQEERAAVESEAVAKLASKAPAHEVIERCASLARGLVQQRISMFPEGA